MVTQSATNSLSHDPLLGKTVGDRYVVERLIGRGGVGLVYLATDTQQHRQLVIKVLAPHWAEDRDAVIRFEREAKRMAELDHPNVVKMFDHGQFEGRTYIVMEFIRGEPLRRYLGRRKRLPLEEFIPIAAQILLGVGYVHERGIMLRDIKPPNIMLSEHAGRANHVKMLDFGLARLIEEEEEEVTKAHVIGTAAYMSPEQIRGEAIDVRVDVYALGVLFFLMLTGETPISGDNDAAVLVNHVHGKPKLLAERLPRHHRIPPKLIELVESCLAKDPADRPADATAMAEALFEFIPAPLFDLPIASQKTRAAAETYWAARMSSGAASVAALQSDTSDSAEWTRPLLRKAARTGEAPLKLAEEEIAALKKQAQQAPPRRPRAATGSGLKPRPATPGSAARGLPPPPPSPSSAGSGEARSRPRSPTGSGLMPRPRPGSGPRPRTTPRPGSVASPLPSIPLAPLVEPDDELDLDFEGSARLDSGASPRPSTPDPSAGSAPHGGSAKLGNRPVANTIRVTAADAKEAVERLEGQLDDERNTAKHTTVPPSSDPDGSDVVAISFEDVEYEEDLEYEDEDSVGINEDTGSVGKAQRASPTVPLAGHDPLGQPATYVGMAPAPARSDSGMRVGMIVALAGVLAVALGGLSAYLLLGDQGETETETQPPTVATPTSDAREEVAARTAAAKPTTQDPEQSPAAVGTVTVRAVEGARVAVDGEDRGEAPVELELPLGEHRVRITAPGHHPWESTIDVIPGANPAVRAELVAAEEPAPTASTTPSKGSGGRPKTGRRPKAGKQPSAPSATDEPAPPKPEPKPDVFMDSKKGKDDGIFLPVGGQ